MQVSGNPFQAVQQSSFDMTVGASTSRRPANGHRHNGTSGGLACGFCPGQKRKLAEAETMEEPLNKRCNHFEVSNFRGRNFLPVAASANVYQSEVVKPRGETMYRPLLDDVLINMRHIEQVSFETGTFFIADRRGNYLRSDQGHVINMWRFDTNQKQLFISRSLFITDSMKFNELQSILQTM